MTTTSSTSSSFAGLEAKQGGTATTGVTAPPSRPKIRASRQVQSASGSEAPLALALGEKRVRSASRAFARLSSASAPPERVRDGPRGRRRARGPLLSKAHRRAAALPLDEHAEPNATLTKKPKPAGTCDACCSESLPSSINAHHAPTLSNSALRGRRLFARSRLWINRYSAHPRGACARGAQRA